MDQTLVTAAQQLGFAIVFAWACVRLFNALIALYGDYIKYLMDANIAFRSQITILMEQNKMLSIALFGNNPDAQRAYHAMMEAERTKAVKTIKTNLGEESQ